MQEENGFLIDLHCDILINSDILTVIMNLMTEQLPEHITPHWEKLLQRLTEQGSTWLQGIEKQCIPSSEEEHILDIELSDPLGAHRYQVTERLVHQYKNRVLLLVNGRCFGYCRHCFRRTYTASQADFLSQAQLDEVCTYLKSHPEVQEILLSGGDPLVASDEKLTHLMASIRKASPNILIRLCTRGPIFAPERVTSSLLSLLKEFRPLWVIPHINHPAEISMEFSPETRQALSKIVDSGIPMQSQTVLLKGVNDDLTTLSLLFQDLTQLGIRPGYLFQGDLAPGTSHFRVPIEEGVILYEKLRKELSGLSTPVYAVDLPGGGGKVNLLELNSDLLSLSVKKEKDRYLFTDANGEKWKYPLN